MNRLREDWDSFSALRIFSIRPMTNMPTAARRHIASHSNGSAAITTMQKRICRRSVITLHSESLSNGVQMHALCAIILEN